MSVTQFKRTWVWSREEAELYAKHAVGSLLHVCSGLSKLGDLRVDLYLPADVKADMAHLPVRSKSFDTVIWDPPWIHPRNYMAVFELARIARKRILAISHHWVHIPKPFKLKAVYLVKKISPALKLFFVYDRVESSKIRMRGGSLRKWKTM
jgi:hypothetical protein